MKKIVVSAPGKIHLSGEHAVVYGKPAVVVSTSKRMYVTLETSNSPAKNDDSQVVLSNLRRKDAYINEILKIIETKYKIPLSDSLLITINSDIVRSCGMGSSAALAVALIGAVLLYIGQPWNRQIINELAFQAEKFKHGNASGSDPTIVTHGGLLWYRKELDFLKTFWLLPFKIPKNFAPFLLINTGRVENTGELVKAVRKRKELDKPGFTSLITRIEEVTRGMTGAIHDEDEIDFRDSIQENERLLEQLGVVSISVKQLVRKIESIGGVAKISGAGGIKSGSGVVLAVHEDPKVLMDISQKFNFPYFQAIFGGEGVKIEQIVT